MVIKIPKFETFRVQKKLLKLGCSLANPQDKLGDLNFPFGLPPKEGFPSAGSFSGLEISGRNLVNLLGVWVKKPEELFLEGSLDWNHFPRKNQVPKNPIFTLGGVKGWGFQFGIPKLSKEGLRNQGRPEILGISPLGGNSISPNSGVFQLPLKKTLGAFPLETPKRLGF